MSKADYEKQIMEVDYEEYKALNGLISSNQRPRADEKKNPSDPHWNKARAEKRARKREANAPTLQVTMTERKNPDGTAETGRPHTGPEASREAPK